MISDIKVEMPQLRVPISLIVDDSTPGTERYGKFVEEFGDLVTETGIKGKFTVMPYPYSVSIDEALKGYMPGRLSRLIATIKEKIASNFDITPEMLTHNEVVNIEGIGTSDFMIASAEERWANETEWSKSQDKETLTRYISRALEILKNVSLEANGVTSPGDFGNGNEDNYARAVLEAEKLVNHISLTWYFLHTDYTSTSVPPRIAYLDKQNREAVVSIISGCRDYVEETSDGQKEDPQWIYQLADRYISEDGAKGRLAELHASGSYIVFHTHWWRLHRKGSKVGMKVLREVLHRLQSAYGNGVIWMKSSEIARYFTVQQNIEVNTVREERKLKINLKSPFSCQDFTVSLRPEGKIDFTDREGGLRKLKSSDEPLRKNSWLEKNGRVYLCFDLEFEKDIVIQAA